MELRWQGEQKSRERSKIFIIFVDAIFTTLIEPLFTSALDVIGAEKQIIACVAQVTSINSLAT